MSWTGWRVLELVVRFALFFGIGMVLGQLIIAGVGVFWLVVALVVTVVVFALWTKFVTMRVN